MTPNALRAELIRIMPGYRWTVHRRVDDGYLEATGIQSAGSNRMSTLSVEWRENQTRPYCVQVAGYGRRAPWLGPETGKTLAQALRALQEYCEGRRRLYSGLARRLEQGRHCPPAPEAEEAPR